jgi:hypothetical protein
LGLVGSASLIEEPITLDFSLKTEYNGTWTFLPVDVCGRPCAAGGVLAGKICTRDDKALNYILAVT